MSRPTRTTREATTMRATTPRPVPPTIYDTDRPLTMFGRPWSGWSVVPPVLGWITVLAAGLILDTARVGSTRFGLAAGGITLLIMFLGFAAAGAYLITQYRRAPITYVALIVMGGVLIGAAATLRTWHPIIPAAAPAGFAVAAGLGAAGWLLGSVPREHRHRAPAVYCAVSGVAAGLWGTLVMCAGAWTGTAWLVWAALALGGVLTWPATRHAQLNHERKIREARRARLPMPVAAPKPPKPTRAQQWQATLAAAGADVTVLRDGEYPTPAGFALHVRFPLDGHFGYSQLDQLRTRLETAIGHVLQRDGRGPLRPDAIRIKRAKTPTGQLITTEAYIFVDVEDILRAALTMPEDSTILGGHQALSVYDAFTVGRFIDGSPIVLSFANIHALIAGQTRKGKSSFLDVLINLLSLCYDAVIWMYDGKGGATVWEWIKPYVQGDIDPTTGKPVEWPIYDWVVIDRFGAEAMFNAACDLARGRPGIRRRTPAADGGGKWKASAEYPVVFVLCDESSQAVGAHVGPGMSTATEGASSSTLAALMTNLVCLGAGEGVYLIVAAQRGTVDMMGSGTAKSQLAARMAFPLGGGAQEASEVFQGQPEASRIAAALTIPGTVVVTGFNEINANDVQPGKMFFMGEGDDRNRRVRRAAIEHAGINPGLDDESAALIGKWGYAVRWTDERFIYWMQGRHEPTGGFRRFDGKTPTATAATPAPTSTPTPATPAPSGDTRSAVARLGLVGVPNPFAAGRPATPPARQPSGSDDADWRRIEAEYAAELAGIESAVLTGRPYEPVAPTPPAAAAPAPAEQPATPVGYDAFVRVVRDAGQSGISIPSAYIKMGDAAPRDRKTLYPWRDRAIRDGVIVQPVQGYGGLLYAKEHWTKAA